MKFFCSSCSGFKNCDYIVTRSFLERLSSG